MSLHIRWNLAMFLLNVTEYIVTEIAGLHGLATLHIGKSKNLKKKNKSWLLQIFWKKVFCKTKQNTQKSN